MSDDQEPRRDPRADETRQFDPFDDADDRTRPGEIHPEGGPRSGDNAASDRTRQMPATPGDDATVATPRRPDDGGTAVMPPVQEWTGQEAAWAGRAEVRPPRPGDYRTTSDWDPVAPPDEPRGKWWMPILVGILALILLGLLGWGIYLIAQNSDDEGEAPAPAPSVTAPATTEPSTTPPTTEPTTTAPTTTPPTTQPTNTEVTVPALVGLSQLQAQQALERRGLNYRLIFRSSDAAPGTVIDSDPAEGQEVPPDTQVTLVIAAPPTTQPGTPPTEEPDDD
jgi:hypothetical protein